jgi:hypothetical protein
LIYAGLWLVNVAAPSRWYGSWGGSVAGVALNAGWECGHFRFMFAYQMNFGATSERSATTLSSKHNM